MLLVKRRCHHPIYNLQVSRFIELPDANSPKVLHRSLVARTLETRVVGDVVDVDAGVAVVEDDDDPSTNRSGLRWSRSCECCDG